MPRLTDFELVGGSCHEKVFGQQVLLSNAEDFEPA